MARILMILVVAGFGLFATTALAGTVNLPYFGDSEITFDTAQFATSTGASVGTVRRPGRLLGYDLSTLGSIGGPNFGTEFSSLQLYFGGDLWNGTGADLWIYELGDADDVQVRIGSSVVRYTSPFTGAMAPPPLDSNEVRLVAIDLDDFGLGSGDTGISSITIETATLGSDWHTPDVAAVAANLQIDGENGPRVAVVPLPSAGLMGLGLLAVALAGRALRRRRR